MASKSNNPIVVCNLAKYLEKNHSEFYKYIDDLCLMSLLSTRGRDGLIFIIPTDKTMSLLKSEVEDSFSSVEDHDKPKVVIRKHFVYAKLSGIGEKEESYQNGAGESVKISHASGNKYILYGKSKKVNLSASNVKVVNTYNAEVTVLKAEDDLHDVEFGGKIGKGEISGGAIFHRSGIATNIYEMFLYNVQNRVRDNINFLGKQGTDHQYFDPYLGAMNALWFCILKEDRTTFLNLIKHKDSCPFVDFYMTVQPFRKDNAEMGANSATISSEFIYKWGGALCENKAVTFNDKLEQETEIRQKDKDTKNAILLALNRGSEITPAEFDGFYDKYCTEPGDTKAKLIWMDEFRVRYGILYAEAMTKVDPSAAIKAIVNDIKCNYPGNNYEKESYILSKPKSVRAKFLLNAIICSDAFCHNIGLAYDTSNGQATLIETKDQSFVTSTKTIGQVVGNINSYEITSLIQFNKQVLRNNTQNREYYSRMAEAYSYVQ